MAGFEVFRMRSSRSKTTPMVTIQARGTFALNRGAYEELGQPVAVELLYDRDKQLIGMRAVEPSAAHAYPVRKQAAGETYLVSGAAFTKRYGLRSNGPRRYVAVKVDGVLTINPANVAEWPLRRGKRGTTVPPAS